MTNAAPAICPHETFAALERLPVVHAFTRLVPGVDVRTDRSTALARIAQHHDDLRAHLGIMDRRYIIAKQVHGADVAVVNFSSAEPITGVDALVTNDPRVCLGIYVADCGPVLLVDPVRRAIGCIHSGRKGTDLGVVPAAIATMVTTYGSNPADIVAQVGPCIRPPHYEVDFAAEILRQCRSAGLLEVHDCGTCTASDSANYYSYRREKGQTGRMVALLALR